MLRMERHFFSVAWKRKKIQEELEHGLSLRGEAEEEQQEQLLSELKDYETCQTNRFNLDL